MSIAEDLADKIFHTAVGVDSDTLFEALSFAVGGAALLAVEALDDDNPTIKARIEQSMRGARAAIAALQSEIAEAVKAEQRARSH